MVDEFVLFGRSMGLGQAAVELQVSFALLFWVSSGETCATGDLTTLRTEQTAGR